VRDIYVPVPDGMPAVVGLLIRNGGKLPPPAVDSPAVEE
jgi:hypothetical protein